MSRDFTKDLANEMQLANSGADLFDNATSIFCSAWVYVDTLDAGSSSNYILSLPCSGSANGFRLVINASAPRLIARPVAAEADKSHTHSATLSTGSWVHVVAGVDFPNALIYTALNGTMESGSVSAWTTTAFQGGTSGGKFRIGASATSTLSVTTVQMDGRIAHVAFWKDIVLTSAEVAALYAGISPLRIRTDALQLYYPLWAIHSPEIELVNNKTGTITGTIAPGATEPPVQPFSDLFDDPSWTESAGGTAIGAISSYHRTRMAA